MPPKRRSGGPASATRGAQSTLSFNSKKGASSQVTKSSSTSTTPAGKDTAKKIISLEQEPRASNEPDLQVIAPPSKEIEDVETEDVEVRGIQAEVITLPTKPEEKTKREQEAEKISDAAVRRYWKKEEESRIAPREKILRHFDLSSQYGPCIGISRLKRWKRAESLGLSPPVEVLAVLMKEEEADTERKKEEEGRWKRAYIDELMEGRTGIVE
ncbi:putative dna polymerase delta subunit [Phaeomoniella chlamydospora]|uniref:Putative dna polymerase delta subunit n=1 Tax=Phaeomoniella chlamydospora TaxID=158046 RepID=A0A0G2E516_PHACM|nr:putative dna polymerase delta subunit [Phaeomoniella chlamydospora]